MNRKQLIIRIFKGVIAGALVGIVIGDYIAEVSIDELMQNETFNKQLYWMIFPPYFILFTVLGPYIAVAFTGLQIRNAIYGFLCSIALIVVATISVAIVTGIITEIFTDTSVGYKMGPIAENIIFGLHNAWKIGFPLALIFGPPIGIFVGKAKKSV